MAKAIDLKKANKTELANILEYEGLALWNPDKKTPVRIEGDKVTYQIDFDKDGEPHSTEYTLDYSTFKALPISLQADIVRKKVGDTRNRTSSSVKTDEDIDKMVNRIISQVTVQSKEVQERVVNGITKNWK